MKPLLYTAQDVARFCEVDLKTIHHWADAGKIAHHRTEGRHLRFRHVPLVKFLQSHGYPLHDELASAKPTIFLALSDAEEPTKKLSPRFFVRSYGNSINLLARLTADQPDVVVASTADPTWSNEAITALKSDPETSWPFIVAIVEEGNAQLPTADLNLPRADLARLPSELAKSLGLD